MFSLKPPDANDPQGLMRRKEPNKQTNKQIAYALQPKGQWPWDLVCSIGDVGLTRFAQVMNLG